MAMALMLVLILSFTVVPGWSAALLDDETFWQPFDLHPSLKVIRSLPEAQREAYFPFSRKEVEVACRDLLWSATDVYYEGAKVFVAATPYPKIQRRFAARSVALSPLCLEWVCYHDATEDEFVEWVLALQQEFDLFTYGGRDNACLYGWLLLSVFSLPEESMSVARERAFWTLLRNDIVTEEELPKIRTDSELVKKFWGRVAGMGRPRYFWEGFAAEMPPEVVEAVFTNYERPWLWFLPLDDWVYVEAWSAPLTYSSSPEQFFRRECERYYRETWKKNYEKSLLDAIRDGAWGVGVGDSPEGQSRGAGNGAAQ
jgi:hypothetical protein